MAVPFPFASAESFAQGCRHLVALWEQAGREQDDWQAVELSAAHDGQAWLRISRPLRHVSLRPRSGPRECFDPAEESDEEALLQEPRAAHAPRVEYSVLLSPTYRVPVLYLQLRDMPPGSTMSVEDMLRSIVPPPYRDQVGSVGIMGAISMTNHPVTDMPVLFVHPCNTATALQETASGAEPTPTQYLPLWLGVIGGCVGLQMPMALASRADRSP